jgi:hypothetical protein
MEDNNSYKELSCPQLFDVAWTDSDPIWVHLVLNKLQILVIKFITSGIGKSKSRTGKLPPVPPRKEPKKEP